MITQMRLAPGQSVKGLTATYTAGQDGIIDHVETGDVGAVLAAGGVPVVIPATINLMVGPGQVLYFDGATRQADETGLIRDIPFDVAIMLIKDPQHPAREATEAEAAADEFDAADGLAALAATTDTALPSSAGIEMTGPATITDASEAAPHDGDPLPETAPAAE